MVFNGADFYILYRAELGVLFIAIDIHDLSFSKSFLY